MSKLAGWAILGTGAVVVLGGVTGTPPWQWLRAVVSGDKKAATTVKGFESIKVPTTDGTVTDSGVSAGEGASGGVGAFIAAARAKIGKPYLWGADGPKAYDCSGLVKTCAKEAANLDLPHHAADQWKLCTPVDGPAPGVLFFLGHPAYHVGICVDANQQIEAPDVGLKVRQAAIPSKAYFGRIL